MRSCEISLALGNLLFLWNGIFIFIFKRFVRINTPFIDEEVENLELRTVMVSKSETYFHK